MAQDSKERARFYRETLQASREGGVRFAQEILLDMDRGEMTKSLAHAVVGVRSHLADALGCTPPEVVDCADAFTEAAVLEWTRIRAAMGSMRSGLA
ncbi:MAG: hypothetical protein DI601_05175 [Azospirillum brasilense]|nr:MAG: hypothetical protein DI601_05175 [Azospirillum brasilense]